MRSPPFQKCIVFHSSYKDIPLAVVKVSPIFPKFPSMLVPFSLIRNHIVLYSMTESVPVPSPLLSAIKHVSATTHAVNGSYDVLLMHYIMTFPALEIYSLTRKGSV